MILNALCDYYDILAEDSEYNISPFGFKNTDFSYVAIISEEGDLRAIHFLVDPITGRGKSAIMPVDMKISGIASSPVCDNFAYIFGISVKDGVKQLEEKKFTAAKDLHLSMFDKSHSKETKAIVNFFKKWDINKAWENEIILQHYIEPKKEKEKVKDFQGNIVFKLSLDAPYFHECDEIKKIWMDENDKKERLKNERSAQCSITGEFGPIAKLHYQLKGVKGASSMGTSLVCFNKDSDLSYNLEQSYNSAVSQKAMFKYSTALKYMLDGKTQKMFIGDDTAVFWASSTNTVYTDIFSGMLDIEDEDVKEEDRKVKDEETEAIIKTVLKNGTKGLYVKPELKTNVNFFVLGLAPNAGRVSVRYFMRDSFGNFCEKIKIHYDDIGIVGRKEFLKISNLLSATVSSKSRDKKINPLLGGAVTTAVLSGNIYPQILFNQAILRAKTEDKLFQNHAAAIKGYLVRKSRLLYKKEDELHMYLNEQSVNTAYVLGRTFAVLEMIQKKALGDKINTTIKDKYFASACSNPSLVFPSLIKLAQYHLAKIEGNYFKNLLTECLSLIEGDTFPKAMNMDSQGRFILGYYQQTQKLYEKRNKNEINKEEE